MIKSINDNISSENHIILNYSDNNAKKQKTNIILILFNKKDIKKK